MLKQQQIEVRPSFFFCQSGRTRQHASGRVLGRTVWLSFSEWDAGCCWMSWDGAGEGSPKWVNREGFFEFLYLM